MLAVIIVKFAVIYANESKHLVYLTCSAVTDWCGRSQKTSTNVQQWDRIIPNSHTRSKGLSHYVTELALQFMSLQMLTTADSSGRKRKVYVIRLDHRRFCLQKQPGLLLWSSNQYQGLRLPMVGPLKEYHTIWKRQLPQLVSLEMLTIADRSFLLFSEHQLFQPIS